MTPAELNEAVARKLGWFQYPKTQNWFHPRIKTHEIGDIEPPDYCHSIAAAWGVVEFIKAKRDDSEYFCLEGFFDGKFHCQFDEASVEADTAPMAICLAFLKLEDK